jgi:hypothetical protein
MSTSRKIIIFIAGLLLLGLAFWLIIFRPRPPATVVTPGAGSAPSAEVGQINETEPQIIEQLQPLTETERESQALQNFVVQFVERWGTYSNQTDLSNLTSLKKDASGRFADFIDVYINEIRTNQPYQSGYYGITTRVGTVELANFTNSASSMTATAITRREETSGDNTRGFNQTAEVRLVKNGGQWLVDAIFWQ